MQNQGSRTSTPPLKTNLQAAPRKHKNFSKARWKMNFLVRAKRSLEEEEKGEEEATQVDFSKKLRNKLPLRSSILNCKTHLSLPTSRLLAVFDGG